MRANCPGLHKKSWLKSMGDPCCSWNRELLQQYTFNISEIKQSRFTSQTTPSDFPSSKLDKVLRGEAVCFDAIYSSVGHLRAPRENQGCLGHYKIMFGVSAPAKKVQTSRQWLVAANIHAKAFLCFAFPNRDHEFQTYISQILNLFAAKYKTVHSKVIAYDKAIRTRVREGTRMLLTDQQEFVNLRDSTSILMESTMQKTIWIGSKPKCTEPDLKRNCV